jgi:hypothetical protein
MNRLLLEGVLDVAQAATWAALFSIAAVSSEAR